MMPSVDPLRILTVADVPEDPNAGAAGAEYQTVCALRQLGHSVDALWSDSLPRRIRHGNLHYLLELPRAYARVVKEHLAREAYDVVHVNQPHGFLAAQAVQTQWPRTAFIHRSHGFEPHVEEVVSRWHRSFGVDARSAWRRAATGALAALLHRHNREIARWADGHIVSSTQDAAFMETRFGVAASMIAVVAQAAPDSYIASPASPMTPARLHHVLYVGQFAFVKAPMIVAAAMNEVAAARADVRFTWVAAAEHHPQIRASLSSPVLERLTLLDWMPQGILREVFDSAGIFLFPSFFEGFGKAAVEAMARGLCVIASDVGGMHDVITNGETGLLVAPGQSRDVSGAVLQLLATPATASNIADAAAAQSRRLTWARTAEETVALYRRRIAAKRVST
jgi:glycosyltransferase involved in cell wall biosynthesis